MAELLPLDALDLGVHRTRGRAVIRDVSGRAVAELSLLPRLFVHRALAGLRAAQPPGADERVRMLRSAGRAFATGTVGGLSADDYHLLVSRVSGLPITTVRAAAGQLARAAADAYRSALCARPEAAVVDWTDPRTRRGSAVWTRRGDVLAVHAAGNHPAVHAAWLEALALGYRVAVRPSRREPLTPHRLVMALREAGFGDDVMLLPTDRSVAGDLIRGADLAIVYGGEDVVARYGGRGSVLAQGPGRSKVLLAGDPTATDLDAVVDSIAHGGGTACVNATAVFVEGDTERVARAIADRLGALPSLPPEDERAVLPVQPLDTAAALDRYLRRHAAGTTAHLDGGIVKELGDGSAVLRPAVFQVDDPNAAQLGIELPFPCVWIAPWSAADGIRPLRNTLVLTVLNGAGTLAARLLGEPSIRNVHVGCPTHWFENGLPHDGYLGEFLMVSKSLVRF